MKQRVRRILGITLAGLLTIGTLVAFVFVPYQVGKSRNYVYLPAAVTKPNVLGLHERIVVSDLHADSLLWDRNLLVRGKWGHVDVPRLLEGNVALQAFSVVTQSPSTFSLEGNAPTPDGITKLAIVERWPPATWTSLLQRALYQSRKLNRFAERSGGKLVLIKDRAELDAFLARRKTDPHIVAGWLTLEGAHALEGDITALDKLYDAGFRMVAPSHLFDSNIGGSSTGLARGGLTDLGREWLRRMEEKKMIVDLAHASEQTLNDVLSLVTRPVVVSHTGVKGTCDNSRNVSDEQLRRIAGTGGLIGIGFWQFATCGKDVSAIVQAVRHAVKIVGAEHVALGSDFDGSVATPIDASQLGSLTTELLRTGLSEREVTLVMGANVIDFLRRTLP